MTAEVVRPGPEWIAPGLCPGGMVVRVYEAPSCVLLLERRLSSAAECERLGEADADFVVAVSSGAVVLVAWDGDTGKRVPRGAWLP